MSKCMSFKPSVNHQSKVLVLGSMPGIKSLEEQQYYAHPQNRFWQVMAAITDNSSLPTLNYDEKLRILLDNNIALWDVIKSCNRDSSLDSKILNPKPNNIRELLNKYPQISMICLNGNKAYSIFKKYFPDLLEQNNCYKLPSTSPANARFSLEKLIEEWHILKSVKY